MATYSYIASAGETALVDAMALEAGISAAVYFNQLVTSSLAQVMVTRKSILEATVIADALTAVAQGKEYTVKLVDGYISGAEKSK